MIILIFMGSNSAVASVGEWEKLGESDGVVTLRKEVPDSPMVAFRGEALIDSVFVLKYLDEKRTFFHARSMTIRRARFQNG
jgi:hypothetical protein